MIKHKKIQKLSGLIVRFGEGRISKEDADTAARRYFADKSLIDLLKPDHTSLSQIANLYVLGQKIKDR